MITRVNRRGGEGRKKKKDLLLTAPLGDPSGDRAADAAQTAE